MPIAADIMLWELAYLSQLSWKSAPFQIRTLNLLSIKVQAVKMEFTFHFIVQNWQTSRPKCNDRSPESNMPRSSYVVFSVVKAGNSTVMVHSGQILNTRFYACSGYLQVS